MRICAPHSFHVNEKGARTHVGTCTRVCGDKQCCARRSAFARTLLRTTHRSMSRMDVTNGDDDASVVVIDGGGGGGTRAAHASTARVNAGVGAPPPRGVLVGESNARTTARRWWSSSSTLRARRIAAAAEIFAAARARCASSARVFETVSAGAFFLFFTRDEEGCTHAAASAVRAEIFAAPARRRCARTPRHVVFPGNGTCLLFLSHTAGTARAAAMYRVVTACVDTPHPPPPLRASFFARAPRFDGTF